MNTISRNWMGVSTPGKMLRFQWLCITVFLLVVCAVPAVLANTEFDVEHTYKLNLHGNQVYRVKWDGWAYAESWGADHARMVDPKSGPYTPPATDNVWAWANAHPAYSSTHADFTANLNGTGSVNSWGYVKVPPGGTRAIGDASSTLYLNCGAVDRKGNTKWNAKWNAVSATTSHVFGHDPISVSFLNLDDDSLQESLLFDLELNLYGEGKSSCENGDVLISGIKGDFGLVMESPYITSGTGSMSLAFSDGLVTQSEATGIFAGLLPGIGTSSDAISFHLGDLSGDINIDFDYGPDNVNGFDATAAFGNGGFAEDVPEPFTLALFGIGAIGLRARRRQAA